MKYLLMALGCYSLITGFYFMNTESLVIGGSLALILIFGALVLAISERGK